MTDAIKRRYQRRAKPELTAERLREALDYDPETGVFTWRFQPNARKELNTVLAGKVAGGMHARGYWAIRIDEWTYLAHRLAWLHVHGRWPERQIDHINMTRLDNRLVNLREATNSDNSCNRPMKAGNRAGLKGVSFHKRMGRWRARITKNGEHILLGHFDSPEEAAEAYAKAVSQYHGDFART